ncbi:MAG: tape measure protein [Flavipsychrobacter sp.]
MGNTIDFILRMKETMSSGFAKVQTTAQSALASVDKKMSGTQKSATDTALKIGEIDKRLKTVQGNHTVEITTKGIPAAIRDIDKLHKKTAGNQPNDRRNNAPMGFGGLGSYLGAAAIGYGAVNAFSAAAEREGLNTALNFATSGNGASTIAFIKNLSDQLGAAQKQALEGSKALYGAMRGGKIPLMEQHNIVRGIMEAGAAMKITANDQQGAMLALAQMASKGVVSAEELRGQLGERLPGAFRLAAEAMGMTEMAFNKHLEKGEILAYKFLPAFAKKMHETYGVAALQASDSATAANNRFQNSLYELKIFMGTQLMPAAMQMINGYLIPAARWIRDNWGWLKQLGGAVLSVALAWKTYTAVQSVANAVMAANPVMLLVGALGLLAYKIAETSGAFDRFTQTQQDMLNNPALGTVYSNAGIRYGEAYGNAFADKAAMQIGDKMSTFEKAFSVSQTWKDFYRMLTTGVVSSTDETDRIYGQGRYAAEYVNANKKLIDANKLPGAGFVGNSFRQSFFDTKGGTKNPAGIGEADAKSLQGKNDKIAGGGGNITYIFNDAIVKDTTIHAAGGAEAFEDFDDRVAESVLRVLGSNGKQE